MPRGDASFAILAAMDLRKLAAALRRRQPLGNLIGDVARLLFELLPCDGMRFDLADERGGMWTRIVRQGEEPQRPSLGTVARLKTRETFEVTEEDGVHQVVSPLGLGDQPAGRWTLRRRSGAFSASEIEDIRHLSDVLSVALRARPFEPPAKVQRFGDEPGELV